MYHNQIQHGSEKRLTNDSSILLQSTQAKIEHPPSHVVKVAIQVTDLPEVFDKVGILVVERSVDTQLLDQIVTL